MAKKAYKKKIALHDGDKTGFPNFALMKLSAYHKARRDKVDWFVPGQAYDEVYSSKVMSFTPTDPDLPSDAVLGGTGYRMLLSKLSDEVDACFPDYSLYPDTTHAIGFLTRGCIRKCPWCCVPEKEGAISSYNTWEQVKRPDSNDIVFMDNNVLACDWGLEQIDRMAGQGLKVDFNQGLDARLITHENAKKLAKLQWYAPLRMSCDVSEMLPVVEQATAYLREEGCVPKQYFVYVLVKDVDDDVEMRILKLDHLGLSPYVMAFRDLWKNEEPNDDVKKFMGWVNNKLAFKTCTWQNYISGFWQKERYRRVKEKKNGKADSD